MSGEGGANGPGGGEGGGGENGKGGGREGGAEGGNDGGGGAVLQLAHSVGNLLWTCRRAVCSESP